MGQRSSEKVVATPPASRPLCKCHGVPKVLNGLNTAGNPKYQCRIKNRARVAKHMEEHPVWTAIRLHKSKTATRIRRKRAQIQELEEYLAKANPKGDGEG